MTKQKIILITGGLGYIGSHAVVAFEEAGYKTVIVDNLSNSSIDSLGNISKILGYRPDFFESDLRDKNGLESIFSKYDFDGVIHFAGLKSVGESVMKPFEYYDNNIAGSMVLFELMNDHGVRNIVFSSSATVYDEHNTVPLTEESLLGTSNPYGTTKLILEYILKDLSKTSGLNAIALRYFNPIGAHSSGFIGEKPNGIPNNLLPYIMDVATGKRDKLMVFGNDYDTTDGTGVRDYIHVVDLADAHIKAYSKLVGPGKGGFMALNIGTGRGTSVLEMVNIAEDITQKSLPYEMIGRRAGDLATVYANADLAKRYLDWEAKKTVEEGIRDSWRFNSDNI